jgi:hypothetical protein
MQPLAFLCFEMQMTRQYLREKTFGPAQSPDDSANLNTQIDAGTLRGASVKQLPPVASAMQRRVSGSPSQKLLRLIGSWFSKFAYTQGKNRREGVRCSR